MSEATVTSKGQIVIPKDIRNDLNLKSGDKVDFIKMDETSYIIKPKNDTANFWDKMFKLKKQYGDASTSEINWGKDLGNEEID